MTQFHSKALWFGLLALVTCSTVWAGPDHVIVVSALNGNVHYDHTGGKGLKGFVFVKKKHEIQWSCKTDQGHTCGIIIDFGSASPPCIKPNIPGSTPATTVTCDVDYDSINQGCQKSNAGTSCFPYVTKFYKDGSQVSLLDDPEFIVDNSQLDNLLRSLGFVGLLVGGLGGYYFGRRRASNLTP